jgi:hypothetical protein
MSLFQILQRAPSFSDMALWRRILILSLIAAFFFFGFAATDRNLDYYGHSPDHPIYSTGQVFKVYALGYVRYVTLEEKGNVFFQLSDSWAGLALLIAFFVWVTSPKQTRAPGMH